MIQISYHQSLHLFTGKFYMLALFLITGSFSFGQQRQITNQQHFTVEDGLPQSYITSIVQDDDGFIWISTMDGLCRYDGRDFRTFRYSPNGRDGLATSAIYGRGKLENNSLTLYYDAYKADEFNVRTFTVRKNMVRLRLNQMQNIFWKSYRFGTNTGNWFFAVRDKGIGWMNYKDYRVHYANTGNGLLADDAVCAVVQSADGKIFAVNDSGVQVGDTSEKRFHAVHFDTHIKPMTEADYKDELTERFFIVSLPDNRIAIEQDRNIILLDVDKMTSDIIPIPQPDNGFSFGTYYLQVDSKGRLYFEDYGRVYRLENNKLKLLWESTGPPSRISAVFIDRSDVLWVSINAEGLLKIDLHTSHFESYKYSNGFMVDVLDRVSGSKINFPATWNDPQRGYYFRQATDSRGYRYYCNNWFGNGTIYQSTPNGFHKFAHVPTGGYFSAMFVAPDDVIWVFDNSQMVWYCWENPDASPQTLKVDPKEFFNVELADAHYMGGYTWCSTYNDGLFQMDGIKLIQKYNGQLTNGVMPGTLTEICPDPSDKNKFWIGSRGGGLILWDTQKGLQRIYTTSDGLPNNTIYCMLPDKKGNLWCSTNKGIFRFVPSTGQATSYQKTDGLTGNEFNRAHKFAFSNGRLAFGGLGGYTIFNPADFDVAQRRENMSVLLTGFQINNDPQGAGTDGHEFKNPLSTLSKIELPYNKNYLRFEFAAMRFNQPQKIKYRYQLTGVDAHWVENGNTNIASYAALPAGRYIFRINATGENGLWSNSVKEITIIILAPFWATWWAWVIYGMIIIGLVRWYFLYRMSKIRMQQNIAFERKEAKRLREIDEMKDRFFSNVTHEFRTPLTLIATPLEQLEKDTSLSATAVNNVKIAKRNTRQLLKLINKFLDFSKLESGQMKLKESTGEIELFTANRVAAFETAAKEKNIQLNYKATDIAGYYLFDEEKWETIINNLLSNAVKFTPGGGRINVSLSSFPDNHVMLSVEDNGPGIPAEQQKKVFERFYQVDDSPAKRFGGTGIGLSLVKELAVLMGGDITLESQPDRFTRFVMKIPVRKVSSPPSVISETIIPDPFTQSTASVDLPLVLIAEDNDELRSFLIRNMKENYHVLVASDGLKARDVILNELPDIVVSDVMMPGMDGFELCKMVKTGDRTAHIGFILLTSKAAHDSVLKGLDAGADDYISKPFSMEELELRLGNLYQLQIKQRERLMKQLNLPYPMARQSEDFNPFLLQLFKEIDARLDDTGLGVNTLCNAMAVSRSTLNRKLKSLTGTSANDLIRKYRLQKAAGFLSDGLDIASSAYKTGFSSPSYFSQCFKEQYGVTPSQWLSRQS